MPTPSSHVAYLKDADAHFLMALNEEAKASPFAQLVWRLTKPEGYANIPFLTRNPTFKKLVDEHTPEGFDAKRITITTEEYINAVEIPRKALNNAKGRIGPEYMKLITAMAEDVVGLEDQLLTTLIEGNGNDVFGSAFFGSAVSIFNSAQTVTNTGAGAGVAVDNVKTDFDDMRDLMVAQKNAGGRLMHGAAARKKGFIAMFPTALASVMEDAFVSKTLTTGGVNKYAGMGVELVENPLLSDDDDWFLFLKGAKYEPFILIREREATTESNAGGEGSSNHNVERAVQLTSKVTYSANYLCNVTFGSRMAVQRTVNT